MVKTRCEACGESTDAEYLRAESHGIHADKVFYECAECGSETSVVYETWG